jgi:geranylgeranyl diphosphate synthase, type I
MVLSATIQSTLLRYQREIDAALRAAVHKVESATGVSALDGYYGQMQYHLGWVDANLAAVKNNPGKLLRPTLLLLAYEAAGAWGLASNTTVAYPKHIERALPAAAAIELTHNFTLIHDDVEDGDTERRHRATVWKLWGVPQAINTGDGMYALARLTLWGVLDQGVEGTIAARLGETLDRTCLVIAEGQYLDMTFETRQDISVSMYKDMISRKTAALMECAAQMGGMLGTRDQETIKRLSNFGRAIGIAFQLRDDILGIWATAAELGKTQAGDIYRRKKTLPVLHALEQADTHDRQVLSTLYTQETPVTAKQVEEVLAVLERTQSRAFCLQYLAQQCQLAHEALASIPHDSSSLAARALKDLETLVHFVEETV